MTQASIEFGQKPAELFVNRQLELFALRCCQLADRVAVGKANFIETIDMLHDAAVASGLADDIGDDAVQAVMAAAFATVPKPETGSVGWKNNHDA